MLLKLRFEYAYLKKIIIFLRNATKMTSSQYQYLIRIFFVDFLRILFDDLFTIF